MTRIPNQNLKAELSAWAIAHAWDHVYSSFSGEPIETREYDWAEDLDPDTLFDVIL